MRWDRSAKQNTFANDKNVRYKRANVSQWTEIRIFRARESMDTYYLLYDRAMIVDDPPNSDQQTRDKLGWYSSYSNQVHIEVELAVQIWKTPCWPSQGLGYLLQMTKAQ